MKLNFEYDSSKIGILSYDLNSPEGEAEFKRATKSLDAFLALWDIAQEVFRPARKHGYANDPKLNVLIENQAVGEAIGLLETKFYEILDERGVNPGDFLE